MLACHCNAVTEREIRHAVLAGALDAADVARRCGAGARCGGCRPVIDALLAESRVHINHRHAA